MNACIWKLKLVYSKNILLKEYAVSNDNKNPDFMKMINEIADTALWMYRF